MQSVLCLKPEQNQLILKLKEEGWDVWEEELSLAMIVMLGKHEGISFNCFVESWGCDAGVLYIDEFKHVDGEYTSDQDYPSQMVELKKLSEVIAPYTRRGYDWQAELTSSVA